MDNKYPYNEKLKKFSKELRQAYYLSEALLWQQLNKKQFKGLQFYRQKIIGNYIVDFYCARKKVIIEIDGQSHDFKGEYDEKRNLFLKNLGFTVIHFLDNEIRRNLSDIMEYLKEHPAFT